MTGDQIICRVSCAARSLPCRGRGLGASGTSSSAHRDVERVGMARCDQLRWPRGWRPRGCHRIDAGVVDLRDVPGPRPRRGPGRSARCAADWFGSSRFCPRPPVGRRGLSAGVSTPGADLPFPLQFLSKAAAPPGWPAASSASGSEPGAASRTGVPAAGASRTSPTRPPTSTARSRIPYGRSRSAPNAKSAIVSSSATPGHPQARVAEVQVRQAGPGR